MSWELVKARTTQESEGWLRAEVYSPGYTLIEYYNFVVPGGKLAGMRAVRKRALAQLSETVEALKKEVPRRKKEEAERFQKNLQAIREALRQTR
jgi:hypothetical protein